MLAETGMTTAFSKACLVSAEKWTKVRNRPSCKATVLTLARLH